MNSYLGKEEISQDDKILLIYHQILEELHEGCSRSQILNDQKDSLDVLKKNNVDIIGNMSKLKDQLKQLERDLTIEMMKSLEIKKESDRICELENSVNAFELSQDEINKCIMKEDPKHLNDNLKRMVLRLEVVKK